MKKLLLALVIAFLMQCISYAQNDLFSSCLSGNLDGVKQAVEGGADVNAPDPKSGQNALAYAFFYPEIIQYLLEKGCDPNGGSYPALVSAASVGSYDVMKLLLENGADPNKKGGTESPLLKVVQMTNSGECAELLLSKGADKNTTGGIYANLIGVYASYGLPQNERKEAMIKYGGVLKNYGLTVPDWYFNPSDKLNGPPEELLKVLVTAGIDINKRGMNPVKPDEPGEPPLFTAMNVGKEEIILSLLNNGADYNAIYTVIEKGFTYWNGSDGYTPLMYACVKKYITIINWLLAREDLVNHSVSGQSVSTANMIFNFSGLSAMYIAIMNEDMEAVTALAESSLKWEDFVLTALPKQKFEKSYGSKPVGKAYEFGKFGAKKGEKELIYTPSLYADFLGQKEMADYLKSKGI